MVSWPWNIGIYRQTHQQTSYAVTETLNTGKSETPYQTLHDNDSYTANTQMQTLTQEEKTNVDVWKEKNITISQETRLKESQVQNRKSERQISRQTTSRS